MVVANLKLGECVGDIWEREALEGGGVLNDVGLVVDGEKPVVLDFPEDESGDEKEGDRNRSRRGDPGVVGVGNRHGVGSRVGIGADFGG